MQDTTLYVDTHGHKQDDCLAACARRSLAKIGPVAALRLRNDGSAPRPTPKQKMDRGSTVKYNHEPAVQTRPSLHGRAQPTRLRSRAGHPRQTRAAARCAEPPGRSKCAKGGPLWPVWVKNCGQVRPSLTNNLRQISAAPPQPWPIWTMHGRIRANVRLPSNCSTGLGQQLDESVAHRDRQG